VYIEEVIWTYDDDDKHRSSVGVREALAGRVWSSQCNGHLGTQCVSSVASVASITMSCVNLGSAEEIDAIGDVR